MLVSDEKRDDAGYMALALAQARAAAQAGEVPVGAVLVQGGRVVAAAHNAPIALCDPTAHAEMRVLREGAQALGNYRLGDCDLYVTTEPCAMCAGAILNARIRRVVYATREPRTGAAGSQLDLFGHAALNAHTQVTGGVLAHEAQALMREFFAVQRARQARERAPRLREDAVRLPAATLARGGQAFGWPEGWRSLWLAVQADEASAKEGEGAASQPWQIHCMQGGAAQASTPLAVLVHGWADHGAVWRDWALALAGMGWRVLVPDLPGHGLSDRPKHARCLSPAQTGGVLARLLHALDWNAASQRVLAVDASVAPLWPGWLAVDGGQAMLAAPAHLLWVHRPSLRERADVPVPGSPDWRRLSRAVPQGFPSTPKALAALMQQDVMEYGVVSVDKKTVVGVYPDAGHLTACRQWVQALGQSPHVTKDGPPADGHASHTWAWSGQGAAPEPGSAMPADPCRAMPLRLVDLPGCGGRIAWSAPLDEWWRARLG